MPDTNYDDIIAAATGGPTRTRKGALKFQPDDADWSLDRLPELQDFYSSTYGKKLPVTVKGQGSIHRKWGLDHRASADISLNPGTPEGKAFITELEKRKVPFLAFDRAIPGSSTGPHIHLGRPSSRGAGNFPVGSQVKKTAKVTPTQGQQDDYTDILAAAEGKQPDAEYTDVVNAAAPTKPAPRSSVLPGFSPRSFADRMAGKQLAPAPSAIEAGVREFENRQATRKAIEAGVAEFESSPPTIDAGNSQPVDLLDRTKAQIRAERGWKADIGMPQALNPIKAVTDYFGYKNEEALVDAEARARIDAGFVESERMREIVDQFTDEDKEGVRLLYDQLRGSGPVSRGLQTGVGRAGSGLLYKLAAITDLAGGPGTDTHPNVLGDYLRRKAAGGEVAIAELEAELPPDTKQQLADFTGHALGALPEVFLATAAGGPVGGFAALGGLEAGGRKQSYSDIARETAKGAVIGGVFKGAGLAEGGGRSLGQRAIDTARSGAVIGVGTYGVEKAFGADDADALKAAASNVVFHAGMRVPGLVGELAQMAEKAYKTPKEEIATVGEDLQARLSAAEARPPTPESLVEPPPSTPATPAVEPVSAESTVPSIERRSPERMKDADWLELTDAERAKVRQEVDAEQAAIGQPEAQPITPSKPSLAETMRGRAEAGPEPTPESARQQYIEATKAMLAIDTQLMDAKRTGLTKAQITELRQQRKIPFQSALDAQRQLREQGFNITPIGELKPRKSTKGQEGNIDLTEIRAGLNELRSKFPDKTERELRGMLPAQHREALEREQPLHQAATQPRTDTGAFAPGAPGGPEAAQSQLKSEARKYASDFKALDLHSARRNGLDIVSDDIARNYFTKLHRMATEYVPELASAVDRAETLYNQGKYGQATMLAESVFAKLPDKVNEYSSAIAAMKLQEMGLEAKTNWRKVLQEVRNRLQRTGGLSGGGSTFYDVNKRPEGGRPDHAKIAYILEPVVEALKADASRLIAEGKLKAGQYTNHIRTEVNKMLQGSDFNDWHPLNKSAAFGVLVDRLRSDGPPSHQPTVVEPPEQRNRSLPPTLEKSGRDPGTNLTYDRLPNRQVNERVEGRLAAEGPEALEAWYRSAPESADRTAAHRVLVDHYTAEAARLADTAPRAAEAAWQQARDLSNLEAERATTLGQTIQMYSNLLKYSPTGVMRELAHMEAQGVDVPQGARQRVVQAAHEHQRLDGEVRKLERDLVAAEASEGGGGPQGVVGGGEGTPPKPRQYRPRGDTVVDSKAETIRRKLDEAALRRRAAKAAIAAQLKQLEQSRTAAGYWKRSMNITRGLMVSALSTAMRNLQSQAVRFDTERVVDTIEHTFRRSVGLDSDLSYRNIWRNSTRQFKLGQTGEAKGILLGHPGEYHRMFNNYAGGVEVPIRGGARTAIERTFQTVERGVEIANVFNRLQEFHLRSAEFLAELDLHLRKEHNQTLEQFVNRNGIDAIPLELIRKGVDKALEVTFADMPMKDGAGGRFLTSMIEVGNYIPPTLSPVAFPRFMFNNLKFLYQYSPAGMVDLARKNQNKPRVIARSLVGTSMLLLAYQFRNSDHAGEKWYELKVGDTTLDARPFGPFSTYLFMAESIRRQLNGEKAFTVEEIAGAIGASTGPSGTAIAVAEKLYDYAANGKWDKWQRVVKNEAGEWGRALLTPIRQVKDLIGAFDASQAVNRDTSLEPALGPIKESIPYADTGLPPAYKPTTAAPIRQERPAVKAVTGWRVVTPKSFLERELDTLNFTSREIRPATGNPQVDQLEKRLMGPLMDELSAELEKDAAYQKLSKKEKAVHLRDLIKDIRSEVREMGRAEHPELYEQLQEERKPERQRQFEQELNSPGLSKAIELGVPLPIPPRRADEDDIAYRARLLQVGRQRRQRLDSAVVAGSRGQQQRALHSALYG